MQPLPHGYTNNTVGDGHVVRKSYVGPDAEQRLGRELAAMTRLRERVPLAPVRGVFGTTLELGFVLGQHGQDLIDRGHAVEVLRACGTVLRAIHTADPMDGDGRVLVHGDFGPNNLLLDAATFAPTAVLDWEFAHLGEPVEDLAWCEWIVRTHHPAHVGELDVFFSAYGRPAPPWPTRHAAMLARCWEMQKFCERWEPGGQGAHLWRDRIATTETWTDSPDQRGSTST